MSLPKWVEKRKESCIPIEEEDIIQAFSIAWETLQHEHKGTEPTRPCNLCEALRRIKELGE